MFFDYTNYNIPYIRPSNFTVIFGPKCDGQLMNPIDAFELKNFHQYAVTSIKFVIPFLHLYYGFHRYIIICHPQLIARQVHLNSLLVQSILARAHPYSGVPIRMMTDCMIFTLTQDGAVDFKTITIFLFPKFIRHLFFLAIEI